MADAESLVPCSCLRCRAQIWANPRGPIGGGYDLMAFDLVGPRGPGDISMLMYHDAAHEVDDEDLEEYGDDAFLRDLFERESPSDG